VRLLRGVARKSELGTVVLYSRGMSMLTRQRPKALAPRRIYRPQMLRTRRYLAALRRLRREHFADDMTGGDAKNAFCELLCEKRDLCKTNEKWLSFSKDHPEMNARMHVLYERCMKVADQRAW